MKIIILGTLTSSLFNFRLDFIKELISHGNEVYAFSSDYTIHTRKEFEALGVKCVDYPLNRCGLNPLADLNTLWILKKEINKIKPDIVFSYFVKPVIYGTLAAKITGVESIYAMIEGLGGAFSPNPTGKINIKQRIIQYIQILLYKLSLPWANTVIVLNPDDRSDLIQANNIKVKDCQILGGIGVNLSEFKQCKQNVDRIRFIFVARLLREKGIGYFLEAARKVKEFREDVDFYVLGSLDKGNPNSLQQSELEQLQKDNIVIYPGHVKNVYEWLAKANVFVLPSYYREGVPRSTQEALAMGRVILTTDVPGCRETVIDGWNGFLISPFSSQELVDKMLWCINNPERLVEMGYNSRLLAEERFDVSKVNARLLSIMGLE